MQKNKKISLTELENIIKEELRTIQEREFEFDNESDDEFEDSEESERNWGGAGESEEEFDAGEFFGNAGDAAEDDIRAEFGDDEFTSFGTMEDPRILKKLSLDDYLDEVIGEGFDQKGLLQLDDAEGNIIKKDMLVKLANGGDKKGRVVGFGDEQGMPIVIVDWAWPTDMKFTDPSEMGKKRENPENLIVQGKVNEDVVDDEGEDEFTSDSGLELDNLSFDTSSIYKWILDALYQLDIYSNEDKAQAMESAIMRDFDITPKNNIENEMGEIKEAPEHLIVQNPKTKNMNEEEDDFLGVPTELINNFLNSLETLSQNLYADPEIDPKEYADLEDTAHFTLIFTDYSGKEKDLIEAARRLKSGSSEGDAEETIEEMRGLGSGVKNSGDRNVKLRDDNAHAPLTNLNESINNSIKSLMEVKITKKGLQEFISEEAKKVAKQLKR